MKYPDSSALLSPLQLERLIPPTQVSELAGHVYGQFNVPEEVVAREGYCYHIARLVTSYLQERHGVASARTEIHAVGSIVHHFTTVPHRGRNGELDTVFDATWQQFIPKNEQGGERNPLLFAGPRIGMIALLDRLNSHRDSPSRPPRSAIYRTDTIW